jgi:hypothetical protein
MRSSLLRDLAVASIACGLLVAAGYAAHARPSEAFDPASKISRWYADLMQPDNEHVSCCGDADAYWADDFDIDEDGQYVAIITDDRGPEYDAKVGRETRPVGTRVVVPNRKLKYDQGNPTGHGIIFVSSGGAAICYVTPAGG